MWPIHRIFLGATTLGKNGSWSDDNEGVLHIPQRSNIRLFNIISRTLVWRVLPSEEMQPGYSISPVDWTTVKKLICTNAFEN